MLESGGRKWLKTNKASVTLLVLMVSVTNVRKEVWDIVSLQYRKDSNENMFCHY